MSTQAGLGAALVDEHVGVPCEGNHDPRGHLGVTAINYRPTIGFETACLRLKVFRMGDRFGVNSDTCNDSFVSRRHLLYIKWPQLVSEKFASEVIQLCPGEC